MSDDPRLALYRSILLAWNERMNLIGPEARRNVNEHIAEAIEAARILQPQGEVLDFGSGGGLPAIPMAVMSPAARFHLVEADQKKWAFLKHVVRECALNAVVYGDRLARALKRFPPDLRFSLVVSRAVGRPEEWVPELAHWMTADGRIALFQGSPAVATIDGFEKDSVTKLTRGEANYLVTLRVPRGT